MRATLTGLARLQTGLINQIEESSRPAGAVGRDLCQQNTKIKFMFHQHDPGGGKVRRLGEDNMRTRQNRELILGTGLADALVCTF